MAPHSDEATANFPAADHYLSRFQSACRLPSTPATFSDPSALPSVYSVTDFATASIAAAAQAAAHLRSAPGDTAPPVLVNRRLASAWFGWTIRPLGWEVASPWDAIAGNYRCGDRFIRLHTNAPAHRDAALRVLGTEPTRDAVTEVVQAWDADELHEAIVHAGGVASVLRSRAEWAEHPQGIALATEPLVHGSFVGQADRDAPGGSDKRPLDGVRDLDLTRVLAGPVATRFLAGLGADVLRVDPLDWNEPGVVPEVNLGKRCVGLDLRSVADRASFETLLKTADILVHGYRPDAMDGLGFGAEWRREQNPGLVDVTLNAWGWSGPWSTRRGFDSIVQVANGTAHAGMVHYETGAPKPLPVQALDHAAGHTMAAAALTGWGHRCRTGEGSNWRTSLAAHGELLCTGPAGQPDATDPTTTPEDEHPVDEQSSWGPLRRLKPAVQIEGVRFGWDSPAVDHRSSTSLSWKEPAT